MSNKTNTFQPFLISALRDHHSELYGRCHILVDPNLVDDPFIKSLAKDGVVILNISHMAVRHFVIDDYGMSYEARFNGVARPVSIKLSELIGILEFNTGAILATNSLMGTFQGNPCIFHTGTQADLGDLADGQGPQEPTPPPKTKPSLKVVK